MNRPLTIALLLAALLLSSAGARAGMLYEFSFDSEADSKPLANTGSIKGLARQSASDGPPITLTRNTPSGSGLALHFGMAPSGTTGPAIVLPDSEKLLLLTSPKDAVTMAMWLRWGGPDKVEQNVFQMLAGKLPVNHLTGWAFGIRDTGALRFMIGGMGYRDSKIPVPINTWTHVAMVFSPKSGLHLFINGKDAGLDQDLGPVNVIACQEPIFVGNTSDWSLPSNAFIDDLRIYDEAVSAARIQLLMTSKATTTAPAATIRPAR